jgi:hypothetical protein
MKKVALLALTVSALSATIFVQQSYAAEFELSGKIGVEERYFFQSPKYQDQHGKSDLSILAEPELYWSWNEENDSVIFKPYARVDQYDSERTHFDIRELTWTHVGDDWELRTGINKVYWGVAEFSHLVDVINQVDSVDDIDAEDKLGQQMVNLSLVRDWGIVDIFVLPGFRERTFAGKNGRLRSSLVVNTDKAQYESGAGQQHVDYALRWSSSIGDFDIGAYWFNGTNREPLYNVALKDSAQPSQQPALTDLELTPYYELMDQYAMDIQATLGDWLWKFEGFYRDTTRANYWASQTGFEYTYVGVFDSAVDVGWLVEYGWDSRGEDFVVINQNDLFFGTRIAFNDAQSFEILAGGGYDLDNNGQSLLIEASRRIGDSYKLSLDMRWFRGNAVNDLLAQVAQDDHLQLTLEKYF